MEDPNSAAVANAVQAGNNFWGRVQSLRENRFTKQKLAISQQQADAETARTKLASEEYNNVTLPAAKVNLATANVGLTAAQKSEFLQSHNPVDSAKQGYGQVQAQKFISQAAPVTDADVATSNERILGKDLAGRLYPAPKAAPGFLKVPMPDNPEDKALLGVPEGYEGTHYTVPVDKFQSVAPQLAQRMQDRMNAEFDKPYDEMSPDAQKAVIESYQKNAPPGVKISDAEAVQAYRSQQLRQSPPPSPAGMGLIPTGGEYDPMNPSAMKINLSAPIGGAGNGSGLTPEQYKDFGQPLQTIISGNEELKNAQLKAGHVANVVSYADEPHPTVSSDKSLIMSYLKTIDHTVRVSEGTITTVMDNMGLPEEIKNKINHVMTGALFTPEHRSWFKNAAIQNLDNARQSAANSLQSQLSIADATGNPLAKGVKLPPNVLPPGRDKTGHGDGTVPGSEGSKLTGGAHRFSSVQQAESANLPKGTVVWIFDPKKGKYRQAEAQ